MNNFKKNKSLLEKTYNYKSEMEHDACGVGLIASTNGKKTRKVVKSYNKLRQVWQEKQEAVSIPIKKHRHRSQLKEISSSKMEYGKIGIITIIPA